VDLVGILLLQSVVGSFPSTYQNLTYKTPTIAAPDLQSNTKTLIHKTKHAHWPKQTLTHSKPWLSRILASKGTYQNGWSKEGRPILLRTRMPQTVSRIVAIERRTKGQRHRERELWEGSLVMAATSCPSQDRSDSHAKPPRVTRVVRKHSQHNSQAGKRSSHGTKNQPPLGRSSSGTGASSSSSSSSSDSETCSKSESESSSTSGDHHRRGRRRSSKRRYR
jgi:hypothetical protein